MSAFRLGLSLHVSFPVLGKGQRNRDLAENIFASPKCFVSFLPAAESPQITWYPERLACDKEVRREPPSLYESSSDVLQLVSSSRLRRLDIGARAGRFVDEERNVGGIITRC